MDRNEILANFQACTGIEDITECIATLEQCDWNLNEAVSIAIASASSSSPPADLPEDLSTNTPSMFPSFGGADFNPEPARMIHFEIRMDDMTRGIHLDETATLETFRDLAAMELQIPRAEAKFNGWPNSATDSMADSTDLRTLNLPLNVILNVRTSSSQNGANSSKLASFGLRENLSIGATSSFEVPCAAFGSDSNGEFEKLKVKYTLEVTNKQSGKKYTLACAGSKTFEELKFDIHTLTNIVPSKQVWENLTSDPSLLTADRTLGSLDLDLPTHRCSVTARAAAPSTSTATFPEDEDMEVDAEDYADASESFADDFLFTVDGPSTSQNPLMPAEATDDVGALTQFQAEFNTRYGDTNVTPNFFIDSLDAAIQEAFGGPARRRRILAVYLHHDKSIQSNVFCSQLLCAPAVIDYIATHCVIWAWDVTTEFNRKKLLDMCSRHLGSGVADTVKRIHRDGFPMLVLAQGRGRSCEVNSIIQGNTSLDELMVKLIKAVEDADLQKQEDIRMEEISEAREKIKREQEDAYKESLQKDIEKQRKLDEEKEKLEKEEMEKQRIEQEKTKRIEELSQMIPPEPATDCGLPISVIRFRPPEGGDMITRTFLASNNLQSLLNYVGSLGYLPDKFRIISAWPRREVSSLDPNKSLKEHKLFPQDTLIIEERVE